MTDAQVIVEVRTIWLFHHPHRHPARHLAGPIHTVRRLLEISFLAVVNVAERLRIAVGEREPRTLDLHHYLVPSAEAVADVRHDKLDECRLAGLECLRFLEVVAELAAENVAAEHLLITAHLD